MQSGKRKTQLIFGNHAKTSQVAPVVKNRRANAGEARDVGSIPGLGRCPGKKEMATHSSIFAWKIAWTEEPGGLQSRGLQKSDMTEHTPENVPKQLIVERKIFSTNVA